ncbi:MAG TPA: adenine phosphoribosyltransferase [Candidatus Omnitrophota bacterium]|nr:adenine phosphoribosyltransferase [Candidatus Omnitrophota bacterium]HOX09456.1 adenine phosphoribosyltransferase [Candidatus Omnitrophota bacterium]HPN66379.1 adenine phosphoribosyltransferase [Candidatus Omnitrophota bacterium]
MSTERQVVEGLKKSIRDIPDFPKKGIIFKDITTLLKDGKRFREAIDGIAERYAGKKIDRVICVEARGFIFGSAVAYKLGAGIVPVRKKGKLPYQTHRIEYDLEYGKDCLEIHKDAIGPDDNVLIIDDLLATGGTMKAVCDLVGKLGGNVVEVAFLIELTCFNGRERLKGQKVFSLIEF